VIFGFFRGVNVIFDLVGFYASCIGS